MATKLFLRNTSASGVSDSGVTYYDLLTEAGASSDVAVRNTVASGTELQMKKADADSNVIAWISGRVPSGGFTLTTTDISCWFKEANMSANAGGRYRVFKRTAAGSLTELGGGPFNDGVEFSTASSEMTWTGDVTDTAFAENDRIVVKVYLTNAGGTMGADYECTLTFNAADGSSGDSFFNIAETVAFKSDLITGSFAAIESGADTLAATGSVADAGIYGDFAATETGSDSAAIAGGAVVAGDLAATETGSDAASMAGAVEASGDLAATEAGADALAATGSVADAGISGDFAATETGIDALASDGAVAVSATAALSETGPDALSAAVDVSVEGSFAITESGSDAASLAGSIEVSGAFTATETGSDAFSATGTVVDGVVGTFAATETGADTAAASGTLTILGSVGATEGGFDALVSAGSILIDADFLAIEAGSDGAAMSGTTGEPAEWKSWRNPMYTNQVIGAGHA